MQVVRPVREWLPPQLPLTQWDSILPYVEELKSSQWKSFSDFYQWIRRLNELESAISEAAAWSFIHFTQNTQDEKSRQAYEAYIQEVQPRLSEVRYHLYKRYWESPWRVLLPEEDFLNFNRTVQNYLALYRPENVPLETKAELLAKEYNEIIGQLTVEVEGKHFTLPQAALFLESPDRSRREEVWWKIHEARLAHAERLEAIMEELIAVRTQIAHNAGFENYYDFRFRQLGRFDWTVELCHNFHSLIERSVKRLYNRLLIFRQRSLGLDQLMPWDLQVDPCDAHQPLRPFQTEDELISKGIEVFRQIHPRIAEMVSYMRSIGHLDLFSRPGKAPGGYNYTLQESGLPFIFMNAAGSHGDLVTFVHEVGHAVHTFQSRHIPFMLQRDYPSEVAELASMSMELMALYPRVFYPSPKEQAQAWFQQISRIITLLPWVATVDAFQEWMYRHPSHDRAQRHRTWVELYRRFHGERVRWPEGTLEVLWHRQLHIFEVPLYYIEYGLAQLGALQLWHHYDQNPKATVEKYLYALSLGYLKTVPEIYEAAGVKFFFEPAELDELFRFIIHHLKKLRSILQANEAKS
ncbi:MAG: M3 family oligoendopeptidase [Bacteroidia bacterium]|nr:M3 family oligoendopeptidase [Bacteroidia bacterium]MDW8015039.1 M3 family oligoendopeptidase [Bacteroidia bacterium]